MDARPPERLVGINIADPADNGLIQQEPFDLGMSAAQSLDRRIELEIWVEGVPGDMRDAPWASGARITFEHIKGHPAERPLIDEPQIG
ncbi:hypothetical protein GALL_427840 [mine drainage metagenome]|uniref:Uncharacterized protein n=1 Tax=mine drainage metagenome TaxID=410659 RepID=A0A1J5Q6C7_9ZZZZ